MQNHVVDAIAPGNEAERPIITAQLLERLETEPLLTTKLWVLRQVGLIASTDAIPALEALLDSEDARLADAARMAIARIVPAPLAGHSRDSDRKELLARSEGGANRSIRFSAFETLAQKYPKLATKRLAAELEKEASSSLVDFLRVAIIADNTKLRNAALAELESGDVAKQIVVVGGLDSKVSAKLEEQLIALLDTENLSLKVQVLEALARVGSVRSMDSVLKLIEAKPRDLSIAASDTLAMIKDSEIDKRLLESVKSGSAEDRILALKALSYRATDGVTDIVNEMVANPELDEALREEAISSMVSVGDLASLPILVKVVTDEPSLRRDAQKALKRMTLRTDDEVAAWAAFKDGLENADDDAKVALIQVLDSAPSKEAIEFLLAEWERNDAVTQKIILRLLTQWRNWDGGFALLQIQKAAPDDKKLSTQCFKGISRLILASDATYPLPPKYELVEQAFAAIQDPEDKETIIAGFKNCDWKDGVYIKQIEIDDTLRLTIEGIVGF